MQHVAQMATSNKGVTEPCHYPLWPYVPTFDNWVSMWVHD